MKQKTKQGVYNRPNGYEEETNDCVVRALTLITNMPYPQIHKAWENAGRKSKHGVKARKVFQKVCKELELEAKQVKRSGSLKKLIEKYPKDKLFCLKRGHAFALIYGIPYGEHNLKTHIKGAWIVIKKLEMKCKISILEKNLGGFKLYCETHKDAFYSQIKRTVCNEKLKQYMEVKNEI